MAAVGSCARAGSGQPEGGRTGICLNRTPHLRLGSWHRPHSNTKGKAPISRLGWDGNNLLNFYNLGTHRAIRLSITDTPVAVPCAWDCLTLIYKEAQCDKHDAHSCK